MLKQAVLYEWIKTWAGTQLGRFVHKTHLMQILHVAKPIEFARVVHMTSTRLALAEITEFKRLALVFPTVSTNPITNTTILTKYNWRNK